MRNRVRVALSQIVDGLFNILVRETHKCHLIVGVEAFLYIRAIQLSMAQILMFVM